jgi:hypothetical protein
MNRTLLPWRLLSAVGNRLAKVDWRRHPIEAYLIVSVTLIVAPILVALLLSLIMPLCPHQYKEGLYALGYLITFLPLMLGIINLGVAIPVFAIWVLLHVAKRARSYTVTHAKTGEQPRKTTPP